MIEIVIKIEEETYNRIMNGWMPLHKAANLMENVQKGIPLPKHHGRLIYEPTKEEIEKTIGGQSDFAECIRDSVKAVFDNAPTIIEANKESE